MAPRPNNFNGLNYEQHAPGSELKGGGYRGGPKRWTGKGPKPARHIPWPEIFRHHLSVVEGHEKMIDMIRKHTVEGSGNWRTINTMLERCREMLAMTKKAAADFVPPSDRIDQVAIGSSSASMYPGYSPADHIYGQAAADFGKYTTQAQREGKWKPEPRLDGPTYQIGQAKARNVVGWGSSVAGGANAIPLGTRNTSKDGTETVTVETKNDLESDEPNPYFVIDTNPTPLISALVERPGDAKEKEPSGAAERSKKAEKKQRKGKKRKRESDGADSASPQEAAVDELADPDESQLKKKKKEDKNAKDPDALSKRKRKRNKKVKQQSSEGTPAKGIGNAEPSKKGGKKAKKGDKQ